MLSNWQFTRKTNSFSDSSRTLTENLSWDWFAVKKLLQEFRTTRIFGSPWKKKSKKNIFLRHNDKLNNFDFQGRPEVFTRSRYYEYRMKIAGQPCVNMYSKSLHIIFVMIFLNHMTPVRQTYGGKGIIYFVNLQNDSFSLFRWSVFLSDVLWFKKKNNMHNLCPIANINFTIFCSLKLKRFLKKKMNVYIFLVKKYIHSKLKWPLLRNYASPNFYVNEITSNNIGFCKSPSNRAPPRFQFSL